MVYANENALKITILGFRNDFGRKLEKFGKELENVGKVSERFWIFSLCWRSSFELRVV